jgi:hypothetical protein
MKTILKSLSAMGLALLIPCIYTVAQIGVNSDGSAPDNSAMLEVKATDRGLLLPRLSSASRDLLPSPATGLLIYNTTTNKFNFYNGSYWYQMETAFISSTTGTLSPGGGVSINASPNIYPDNSAILDVNNPTRGILIPRTTTSSITSPATGLIIYNTTTNLLCYYNGSQWITLCSVSTGIGGAGGSQEVIGATIRSDVSSPHQSAILDIYAPNKGVLIPRLTNTQRNLILPVQGLVIYNTSSKIIEYYNGSGWCQLTVNVLAAPSSGTNYPSPTEITWNWNTVAGVSGYKWNTSNDYATATDMGMNTSKTETGLTLNTAYTRYIWAYNSCSVSPVTVLTQSTASAFAVGQYYGGGIIFYIDASGQHGLIASSSIIGSALWGCYGTMTGAQSNDVGSGFANTNTILAHCPERPIAASIARDYNGGGYTDWFLPSANEFGQMCINLGFAAFESDHLYWTSSECGAPEAWSRMFANRIYCYCCCGALEVKTQSKLVRAVRAF